MRFSIKLTLPIAILIALIALVSVPLLDRAVQRWFVGDLDLRSALVSGWIEAELRDLSTDGAKTEDISPKVEKFLNRLTQDERIFAILLCSKTRGRLASSSSLPPSGLHPAFSCSSSRFTSSDTSTALGHSAPSSSEFIQTSSGPLHLHRHEFRMKSGDSIIANLYHDASFIAQRSQTTKRTFIFFFTGLLILVAALSATISHFSLRGWIQGVRQLIRARKGRASIARTQPDLQPVARDINQWVRELNRTGEYRDPSQISWSPETLRSVLRKELEGEEILVVSNREPYIHTHGPEGKIQVKVPASGLVTALEPIMRACSGTWIAHGSGDADRETVDARDRVSVPPGNPSYSLRRLWLSEEEEKGYYYGFANEGLWPLCHNAHTRPIFRSGDFENYKKVNRLFADAVIEEAKTHDPVILVQDYHFALLPRMIRERFPDATIIVFWHIPWPNSESFGICPWREELLDGLLGSSILGFHTRFHCHNFLDSVDRYLESRTERETMSISFQGRKTQVSAYPISIEWPPRKLKDVVTPEIARPRIWERHALPVGTRITIGVDRLDYTKGILERFNGVERFLELHPEHRGKFSLIQIGAPTRSNILHYRQFVEQVHFEVDRINHRFPSEGGAPPIILLDRHHEPEEVFEYFRAADACLVTSLHDGMNLVAKEFIGSRVDEDGVLILSQFAGAAKELPEAIVVNPYDVDQCAEAIHAAMEMPQEERQIRMRSMRAFVQEYNVYRWAGRMLLDAAKTRRLERLKEHDSSTP